MLQWYCSNSSKKIKVKAFHYSIPSVGPWADPGVKAVSPQVTVSHPPGGRLPSLSARPAVTSPATGSHRASPPFARYQVILLGDSGTSPTLYPLHHRVTCVSSSAVLTAMQYPVCAVLMMSDELVFIVRASSSQLMTFGDLWLWIEYLSGMPPTYTGELRPLLLNRTVIDMAAEIELCLVPFTATESIPVPFPHVLSKKMENLHSVQ